MTKMYFHDCGSFTVFGALIYMLLPACWQLRKENTIKQIGRNTDQPKTLKTTPTVEINYMNRLAAEQYSAGKLSVPWHSWESHSAQASHPNSSAAQVTSADITVLLPHHANKHTHNKNLQSPGFTDTWPSDQCHSLHLPLVLKLWGICAFIKRFECWRVTAAISLILNSSGWSHSDKSESDWTWKCDWSMIVQQIYDRKKLK